MELSRKELHPFPSGLTQALPMRNPARICFNILTSNILTSLEMGLQVACISFSNLKNWQALNYNDFHFCHPHLQLNQLQIEISLSSKLSYNTLFPVSRILASCWHMETLQQATAKPVPGGRNLKGKWNQARSMLRLPVPETADSSSKAHNKCNQGTCTCMEYLGRSSTTHDVLCKYRTSYMTSTWSAHVRLHIYNLFLNLFSQRPLLKYPWCL